MLQEKVADLTLHSRKIEILKALNSTDKAHKMNLIGSRSFLGSLESRLSVRFTTENRGLAVSPNRCCQWRGDWAYSPSFREPQNVLQTRWRRGRDLNSRWSYPHSGFQDQFNPKIACS